MLGVISVLAVWNGGRAMASRKRAAGYQSTQRAYSQALHPGATRKQVEEYLHSRNVHFTWMFTAFGGRTTSQYADLVSFTTPDMWASSIEAPSTKFA